MGKSSCFVTTCFWSWGRPFFTHRIALRRNRWTDFHDLHVVRRVSAQGCAFWGSRCYLCPFKGSTAPKTPILGAWIGVFKPNAQNHKTCILSRPVHRFQQFLHNDKDHQVLFVAIQIPLQQIQNGGRPPFWKIGNAPYLSNGLADLDEIWQAYADWIYQA